MFWPLWILGWAEEWLLVGSCLSNSTKQMLPSALRGRASNSLGVVDEAVVASLSTWQIPGEVSNPLALEFSMCPLLRWIYASPPRIGLSSWEGVLRRLLVFVLNHIRWQWICIFYLTLHSFLKWSESRSVVSETVCDPMDYTVHGTLQARILEWIAFHFSRGSSQPRDQTQVSRIAGRFFTS